MSASDYSVLVLGLDGATFDLMLPWVEQGHLPCLGRLLREGACGPLRSVIPPHTPCAWSSFMTGKNPGKHGLFDYVEAAPGPGGVRFTNGASRHGESLWACLSRQGRRVGVMNVPMTYPPEPVNGYLIAGLDTPHEYSPFMYPAELREELRRDGVGYRIDMQHLGNMHNDSRRDQQLRDLCEIETIRTRALQHLRQRYPSDFTMLVYMATDQVQHHFWHYMDPAHAKYDASGAERYQHAIRDVYVHLDKLIASVLEQVDDNTIVIIMSDHGEGPTTDVRLRLNQVLAEQGLLRFAQAGRSGRAMQAAAALLDRLLRLTLSSRTKRFLAGLFPRLRAWFENLDETGIDRPQTAAFVNETYRASPAVWVNGNGRHEDALAATQKALAELKDPQTGRPVISHVYRGRDLYHGPYAANAPDLIPSWWEDGFLLEQSQPDPSVAPTVEHSNMPLRGGIELAATHRLQGILMMTGGPVRRGCPVEGAGIIDLAPTVLYLMGLPIPGDMDGRPLLEALDPEFVANHPPVYERDDHPGTNGKPAVEAVFTEAEAEMIAQRLQAMGYIE